MLNDNEKRAVLDAVHEIVVQSGGTGHFILLFPSREDGGEDTNLVANVTEHVALKIMHNTIKMLAENMN